MEFASFISALSLKVPAFLIIQARISGLFGTLFFFRKEWIPRKILLAASFIFSFFIMKCGTHALPVHPDFAWTLMPYLLEQLALGILTGITINLFVEIFLMMGQFISMQAGLGFVNLYIPRLGNITPLSQFYIITSALIFFELNGHLILVKMIVQSFSLTTLYSIQMHTELLEQLLDFSKIIFNGSVMLSLSVIITLLLTNFTIGIMTKFSPQINIFSIGINISIIVGFFVCYLSYDLIVNNGNIMLNEILSFAKKFLS